MGRVRPVTARSARVPKRRALGQPPPDFVTPCLAKLADAPPEGEAWLHEIKYDGYRLQARIAGSQVRLLTRNGLDWTDRFPAVAQALSKLKFRSALLDGEVVVEDDRGRSSFVDLVRALKTNRSDEMVYYAFDALHLDGIGIAALPLEARKALLMQSLSGAAPGGPIRFSVHFDGRGKEMLSAVCREGMEGIVSKRRDRPYKSGRQSDWLKSKCVERDEFVIGGYVPSAADGRSVGSLALGYFDEGVFTYAGRVGTGFTAASGRALWRLLAPLVQSHVPFATTLSPVERRGVRWVTPKIVAQISYRGRTDGGLLRHAVFLGIREDKSSEQVGPPRR